MSIFYRPSPLENWISEKYKRMKIIKPADLTEERISMISSIFLFYKPIPSYSFENGRFKSITIDNRIVPEIQREHFYHEWCHLLRHVGLQSMMPAAFKELQEYDAVNFTRYAAIPYHMLSDYSLLDPQIIEKLHKDFKVSIELCTERVLKIRKKVALEHGLVRMN